MNKDSKIIILGGSGLLGGSLRKVLEKRGYSNLFFPRSSEVNLLEKNQTENFISKISPEYLFMTAGLVGGIIGNRSRPADFLYQNSIMILNVLESLKKFSPKTKLLYVGSTCIYPKNNPQPIKEERFMEGKLEETNKGYAVAKGMGIVACEMYRKQYGIDAICAMPTNLYGIGDNYDLENGHMIPSLIKKIFLAKKNGQNVTLWGTGNPRREALYNEDCADALIYLMENYSSPEIVNIGTGQDYSIKEFAEIIAKKIGYKNKFLWDSSKPDGTFEKRTDITKLKKIYPSFNPRLLEKGIENILNSESELKKINS